MRYPHSWLLVAHERPVNRSLALAATRAREPENAANGFQSESPPDTLPLSNLDFSGDASVYSGVRSAGRSSVGNDDAAGVGCRPAFG